MTRSGARFEGGENGGGGVGWGDDPPRDPESFFPQRKRGKKEGKEADGWRRLIRHGYEISTSIVSVFHGTEALLGFDHPPEMPIIAPGMQRLSLNSAYEVQCGISTPYMHVVSERLKGGYAVEQCETTNSSTECEMWSLSMELLSHYSYVHHSMHVRDLTMTETVNLRKIQELKGKCGGMPPPRTIQ